MSIVVTLIYTTVLVLLRAFRYKDTGHRVCDKWGAGVEEYIIPTESEMSRRSSQGRGKSARFSIVRESQRNPCTWLSCDNTHSGYIVWVTFGLKLSTHFRFGRSSCDNLMSSVSSTAKLGRNFRSLDNKVFLLKYVVILWFNFWANSWLSMCERRLRICAVHNVTGSRRCLPVTFYHYQSSYSVY